MPFASPNWLFIVLAAFVLVVAAIIPLALFFIFREFPKDVAETPDGMGGAR